MGRRLVSGPRPKPAWPAAASLPRQRRAPRQPSPAPRLACLCARPPADAPHRVPTMAGQAHRVAAMCHQRRRTSQPACTRARLLLLKPLRSLALSRAASPLRQRRARPLSSSPRHRTRRPNSPLLLHLGQQSCARSSASLSGTWCSRLCRLSSSGSAFSRLATVGHGAAMLGRRGRRPSCSSPPCLATFPPSPASREPHAPASSPCDGRQWPPVSLAEPRRRGVTAPAWLRLGRAGPKRPWAGAPARPPPLPFARAAQAKCGSGPADSRGPAQ